MLFVQVMSYMAYFMQTINRKDSAYIYIGLALRMAISLGLHQVLYDANTPPIEREHRRRVWWSTYSLERLLCVTSGHPISIHDQDVGVSLPEPADQNDIHRATILRAYTQLSRILGRIGEEIYRKRQKSGQNLSASVQSIMQSLAAWYHPILLAWTILLSTKTRAEKHYRASCITITA